ncbi:MAG: hypothetical protein ABJC74_00415, partial [Gemmatimonadota bacterium]
GWPDVVAHAYAPGIRFKELRFNRAELQTALGTEGGFWLVSSYHRMGLVGDDGTIQPWIEAHCRRRLVTDRTRLDYRDYRVEASWCGPDPADAAGAP